jgi:UDP-N-acetylmuramate dehydrogenase
MKLEENVVLSRFTTIGTGGPARFFARPASLPELQELLGWARTEDVVVEVIGLGSNVLVHDDGVDALVLRLEGELAEVQVEGDVLVSGGGATNAVCLHRARDAGLGGFEFASAIPGTVGGGVRMNAGAYGSDWSAVMIDALVVDADSVRSLTPGELELS